MDGDEQWFNDEFILESKFGNVKQISDWSAKDAWYWSSGYIFGRECECKYMAVSYAR